jgi:uncharacterized protein
MALTADELQYPPGVRLEPLAPAPPLRGVRADVAAFVGVSARGPLHAPRRLTDYPSFLRLFGPPVPQGVLAAAVEGFFLNGGTAAWVVRVADPEAAAPAALDLVSPAGERLRLSATSPGRWAHRMRCRFVRQSARRFTLVIEPEAAPAEVWGALTFDHLDEDEEDRRLARVLGHSLWLRAEAVRAAAPRAYAEITPLAQPTAEASPSGGADGLVNLTENHFDGEQVFPRDVLPLDEPPDAPRWPPDQPRPMGLRTLDPMPEPAIIAIPDIVWTPPPPLRTREPPPRDCAVLDPTLAPPTRPPAEPPEPRPPFDATTRTRLRTRLIAHCRGLGDRLAILDADPETRTPRQAVAETLAQTDDFAALYWPWLKRAGDPDPDRLTPPSGHVTGVVSAVTATRGVHEPPTNVALAGVAGLDWALDDPTHAWLNRSGVNVLRAIPGRGVRILGGRTLSRESGLRWLNVRRLLCWLADTLEVECAWLPFEPHDPELRAGVARVVAGFLDRTWRSGMLDGEVAEEAYEVICDESVNPPAEVDAGRLVCLIGINPPWPAEFIRVRLVRTDGGLTLETLTEVGDA